METLPALATAAAVLSVGTLTYRLRQQAQNAIDRMYRGEPSVVWPYYVVPPNGTTIRSKKRDFKRELMAKRGVTSGRQWVRLRKSLPPYLRQFTP